MKKKSSFFYNLITLICIVAMVISGAMILWILYPKYHEQKSFEKIQKTATAKPEQPAAPAYDWAALSAVNPDIVGWITIPDTHINYPVVQTTDNTYYLTHNFEKAESKYGCPFLDADFAPSALGMQNAVIYAHSSTYGNQIGFEGLDKYEDPNYFKAHPLVYYTQAGDPTPSPTAYEIVGVLKVPADFDYRRPSFADQADFLQYYQAVLQNALYPTGYAVQPNDTIITLSTCSFDFDDARIAVIARRKG